MADTDPLSEEIEPIDLLVAILQRLYGLEEEMNILEDLVVHLYTKVGTADEAITVVARSEPPAAEKAARITELLHKLQARAHKREKP
jgi:hypothetical protein